LFFKPTLLYKEFLILDLIEKNANITQREISNTIGVVVSMINLYLDRYEKLGLIKRKKHSTKTVDYFVTKKGMERRKLLNIWYLKSSNEIYLSAKENIINFLSKIIEKGFRRILLYGAGEVAEIMLKVINDSNEIPLHVVAVIDDDRIKQNNIFFNKPVISMERIKSIEHDGILVSSFKNHDAINNKLDSVNYNKNKIINFFDNLL
jgi:DNA-binding MarR family transcriptional regulator